MFINQEKKQHLPCNLCPWPSLGRCPQGLGGGSQRCRSSDPPQQGSAPSSLRYHSTGFHVEELRRKNFEKKQLSTIISSLPFQKISGWRIKEEKLWKEAIEHLSSQPFQRVSLFGKKPLSTIISSLPCQRISNWRIRGEKTLKRSHWAPSSFRYHSRGFYVEESGRKKLWKEAIEHHHLFATIPEDFMLKNQGEK